MADLKHEPTRHDHAAFIKKARDRKGFTEAYEALALEYEVVGQLLKARTQAGS
jgi:hypothetical protein